MTLKREGMSILLSEQNLNFAELVSDRAYVLENGHIRYQSTMAQLAAATDVSFGVVGSPVFPHPSGLVGCGC
jgi:branched-chain amino acid transport system ATP-binding protein